MADKTVPLALEKAYTFYMLPFYYESTSIETKGLMSLWEPENRKISDEGSGTNVLYPYIMEFLQGQTCGNTTDTPETLRTFRLKVDKNSVRNRVFWEKFVHHSHIAYIPTPKEDEATPISFNILSESEEGFKAPHMFVYESAKIGILTFCIELARKEKTIEQLKLLNYYLHKIHNPICRCVCPALTINKHRTFENDYERVKAEEYLRQARTYITPHDENKEFSPYQEFDWDIRALIRMWIAGEKHIRLFSDMRLHLFTYCQIDDTKTNAISKEVILPDLFRLSRCVNDKYLLPFDKIEEEGGMLQSFENVYIASSVEGCAFIAVSQKENHGFISQMDGNVRLRYIWVYMLAIIQRYTLLNMSRQMIMVNAHRKTIWDIIKVVKNTKTNCYYTDVSPYTQHNQFYQLCCKNMHIKDLFDEIQNKTEIFNLVLTGKQETKQRQLNWIVGFLTILQAGDAVNGIWENAYATVSIMVLASVIIYMVYKIK